MMTTREAETVDNSEPLIVINGTNDMICAICNSNGDEKGAVGICKTCKYYLCNHCVDEHRRSENAKNHKIAFFYCQTNLKVNKLVRANSFCLDCGHYLCEKCKLEHNGFREYRHHSFIGGKSIPAEPFIHEHGHTQSPKGRRKAVSRMSRSTYDRKSPYISSIVPFRRPKSPPKKRILTVDEQIYQAPRTLIQSTTGRQNVRDSSALKTPDKRQNSPSKIKRVHYEDDQVSNEAELIGEYNITGTTDIERCHVISSVFLENGYLIVADEGNKNIKLYDPQFQFKTAMEIAAFPVALCPSKQSNVEFFASSGNFVFKIGASKLLTLIHTISTDIQKIEGLAQWEHGIALIFKSLKSASDKKGHLEVHLMTFDGEVKFEITISSQFSVKKVTPIWYVTTSNDGTELLLSDTNLNRIISVDIATWHVIYVLRGKTTGGAPRSLTMDPDGNLLVSWYGEVHKISQSGKDLGVPVSKIDKQSIIVYNQKTRQLVVHAWSKAHQDKFRVYNLK